MNNMYPQNQGGQSPYGMPQPQYQQMPPQQPQPLQTPQSQKSEGRSLLPVIIMAVLGLLVLVFGGLSIWLFTQYNSEKTDVDGKISLAEAKAKDDQQAKDQANFDKKEKDPNRQFVGPDDYGRLTFNYPKTWSVYVAKDTSQGGDYTAYLNPVVVPPVGGTSQRFALRVLIQNKDYNSVLSSYDSIIKRGDLTSSAVSVNGQSGTRLDGNFTKDIRGAAVIYKLRDKTISIFTDADTFKPDFEDIIKTIKFNQ